MKVLQTLPQGDLNNVPSAAKAAEAAGFDMVVTMENRHDPFLSLGVAAVETERIKLGTAIAIAFARSPMVVANSVIALLEMNAKAGRSLYAERMNRLTLGADGDSVLNAGVVAH